MVLDETGGVGEVAQGRGLPACLLQGCLAEFARLDHLREHALELTGEGEVPHVHGGQAQSQFLDGRNRGGQQLLGQRTASGEQGVSLSFADQAPQRELQQQVQGLLVVLRPVHGAHRVGDLPVGGETDAQRHAVGGEQLLAGHDRPAGAQVNGEDPGALLVGTQPVAAGLKQAGEPAVLVQQTALVLRHRHLATAGAQDADDGHQHHSDDGSNQQKKIQRKTHGDNDSLRTGMATNGRGRLRRWIREGRACCSEADRRASPAQRGGVDRQCPSRTATTGPGGSTGLTEPGGRCVTAGDPGRRTD